MTDIVERLRYEAKTARENHPETFCVSEDTADEAADEIERLLAKVEEWKQAAGAEADERRRAHEEIGLLREGLNSIANNSCCGTCQEAALVAKRTLEGK